MVPVVNYISLEDLLKRSVLLMIALYLRFSSVSSVISMSHLSLSKFISGTCWSWPGSNEYLRLAR